MPIYRYRCQDCRHVFEEFFTSFNKEEQEEIRCPECGGEIKRLYDRLSISVPSIGKSGDLADDPEEYREMHYYEKKKDWQKAADAAKGVSNYARKKFLQRAREERN